MPREPQVRGLSATGLHCVRREHHVVGRDPPGTQRFRHSAMAVVEKVWDVGLSQDLPSLLTRVLVDRQVKSRDAILATTGKGYPSNAHPTNLTWKPCQHRFIDASSP